MGKLIAVTGGIGSGKSVVCRILSAKGLPVYNCDAEAKRLMENDPEILKKLQTEICEDAVGLDGRLNRKKIAGVVFSDPAMLARLNSIVHGAVRADIIAWKERQRRDGPVFVETAILYQSGLDRMVDSVWDVTAPCDIRVRRAMSRDGADEKSIRSRIEAQNFIPEQYHRDIATILNDGFHAVLPQVNLLLASISPN